MDELETFLKGLPGKMSQKNIAAILEHVEGMERGDDVRAVEVNDARVPVEMVRAYGLTIMVDANGNASTVEFPHGGTAVAA